MDELYDNYKKIEQRLNHDPEAMNKLNLYTLLRVMVAVNDDGSITKDDFLKIMLNAEPEITPCKECKCNCGYTCGGPGVCELDPMECMQKHWKKDCGHDFSGPGREIENGWTATCKHCGMTAIGHDCIVGP